MAKRKPAKKRIKRKVSLKKISKIKPEHYFMVVDGSVIKDLKELASALDKMSDDSFYYHVNEWKNDFYNWTKNVFKELELAEKLLEAGTREQHHVEILKFLLKKK